MPPRPRIAARIALPALLLAFLAAAAGAQELLSDAALRSPREWALEDPAAGAVERLATGGVALTAREPGLANLICRRAIPVTPGVLYRLRVEARGQGQFALGARESVEGGTPIATVGPAKPLTGEWVMVAWDYRSSDDRVASAQPFFQAAGNARAELRNASFQDATGEARLSVETASFIAPAGGAMAVTVRAANWPVKFILYGPQAVSPDDPELGGRAPWTDHFKRSWTQDEQKDGPAVFDLELPPDSVEGAYRLVAVDAKGTAAGVARFTVRSKQTVDEILTLVKKVNLPEGSRLIFVGDSLTALFPDRNYVALLDQAFQWRFGGKVAVYNAGVGGDTIPRIEARLDRDVIEKKPTMVFLFEGANDSKRPLDPATKELRDWLTPADLYESTLRNVIRRSKGETGAKVVMMTCAPGNQDVLTRYQARLREMAATGQLTRPMSFFCMPEEVAKVVAIQKRLAGEFSLDVIDTHAALEKHMAARKAAGTAQFAHVDDGVHLSEYGNREVFLAVLRYLAK